MKSEIFTRHKNNKPNFMDQHPLFDSCPIPTQNVFIFLEISISHYEQGLILWMHIKKLLTLLVLALWLVRVVSSTIADSNKSFIPIFLKDKAYFRHLLLAITACNGLFEFLLALSHSKNFKTFILFRGFSSLICSRYTKICPFFIPYACLAFLKYALDCIKTFQI